MKILLEERSISSIFSMKNQYEIRFSPVSYKLKMYSDKQVYNVIHWWKSTENKDTWTKKGEKVP